MISPKFTRTDVERVLPLKSWWAMLAVLPLVRRLTLLVVNRTSITPNAITVTSILLRFAAAASFALGRRNPLIIGAVCFYLAYLLDCMDGAVARLRKQFSPYGRFLDHIGDLIGGIVGIIGLAFGQSLLFTLLAAAILFSHISESYISYLTSTVISSNKKNPESTRDGKGIIALYLRYRAFFHSRNIKSFFSFPDYECLVFLVFPLLGMPALGLKVGYYFLLPVVLYTILSSFVSIQTGGDRFP